MVVAVEYPNTEQKSYPQVNNRLFHALLQLSQI